MLTPNRCWGGDVCLAGLETLCDTFRIRNASGQVRASREEGAETDHIPW